MIARRCSTSLRGGPSRQTAANCHNRADAQTLASRPAPNEYLHPRQIRHCGVGCRCMSFLDQLAFGPGGDRKAWARGAPGGACHSRARRRAPLLHRLRRLRVPTRLDLHRVSDRGLSRAGRAARRARAQEERPSEGRRHGGVGREHRPPRRRKRALRSRLRFRAGRSSGSGRRRSSDPRTAAAAGIALSDGPARARHQHLQRS